MRDNGRQTARRVYRESQNGVMAAPSAAASLRRPYAYPRWQCPLHPSVAGQAGRCHSLLSDLGTNPCQWPFPAHLFSQTTPQCQVLAWRRIHLFLSVPTSGAGRGGQPHWPCGGSEWPCLTRMHACTHAHEHTLTRLMGTPRRLGQPGWRLRPESLA